MKYRSTHILGIILPLLACLASCASPQPVVRMEPLTEPDAWNYGQAVQTAEHDGIIARASFAYADKKHLVFDVEITNWRETRILVDPAPFALKLGAEGREVPAIDPEARILDMELQASRREASEKNAWLIAGVAAAAAVTAAVVADNNNTQNADGVNNNGGNDIFIAPAIYSDGPRNGSPVQVDPWFWSDQTLRKTTLDKGQQVRGKVVFPRYEEISTFELLIPVEELDFTFGFLQKLYWP